MVFRTIISTSELEEEIGKNDWVIVDCTFNLMDPGWGYEEYQKAHIPGAVYASLDQDLASPVIAFSGRHPLPTQDVFFNKLSEWGIDSSKQVIVYDAVGGAFAVRLWWMLRFYGHDQVAVLDGGFPKWKLENKPVRSGIETRPLAIFHGIPHPSMFFTSDQVEQILGNPEYLLIDARAPERYRGETEPIDPVAGHIPGAVNRFHGENLKADGTFKSQQELRAQFNELLNGIDPSKAIIYCGSGVTSAFHLLGLAYAGLPGGILYVGSWSEWIKDPHRPIEKNIEF